MLALKCNQTALRAISIYNLQLQQQQWVEVCSGAWQGGTRNIGHKMDTLLCVPPAYMVYLRADSH